MKPIDQALEILQLTNDGEDLAPQHLKLLEIAVNGWLSETGEVFFQALYRHVKAGYKKPWLHGIEHLTIDHEGYVYWKDRQVEHYDSPWAWSEEAHKAAEEISRRCKILESRGIVPTVTSVVWQWEEDE